MDILVRDGAETFSIEAEEGASVLAALQRAGVQVDAPCGGGGTCKKCRMLIADDEGVSYRLACETAAKPGMEVAVERNRAMSVSMGGVLGEWPADGAAGEFGLAIDIGTTTVVCRLHDLATGEVVGSLGASNPQLAFGADVISRISACDDGGLESMALLIGDALVSMASQLAREHGIELAAITNAVIAGNTTMQHIAARLDPTSIGVSPFTPQSLFGERIAFEPFARAGIARGEALFAPCVAGYVGGDITCGLLACGMRTASEPVLFLDLGTNGEMALGDENGIVACATAAGPVFEGANVKHGMPAYPGAISKVALSDDGALDVTVIGGGEPTGICGTGLFDAVALMLRCGIVDETGRIVDDDEIEPDKSRGLERFLVEEDDGPAFRIADRIVITQKDVRSLQLAKASVCAGILTMLEMRGLEVDDVARLVIAGGFGEYLDLRNAAEVGIFPSELIDCAESVGNTAIAGASALLVSSAACEEIAHLNASCEYIELSGDKTFGEFYIDQMMFED